jgi:hypothetical protein
MAICVHALRQRHGNYRQELLFGEVAVRERDVMSG